MKKHILLCLTLLGLLTLNAQDDYWNKTKLLSNEDFFEKAELVIEGKILKTFNSYDAKGDYDPNDIYTVQAILVYHVYKGDGKLTNDTIYVVRHFGAIYREITPNNFDIIRMPEIWEDDMRIIDPGIYLDGNKFDILFFVKSDFPENPIKSEYSGHLQYRFLQDKVKAIVKIREKISGLNNLIFNNQEELYNYMKQFKGYSIPDIAPKQLQNLPTKSNTKL